MLTLQNQSLSRSNGLQILGVIGIFLSGFWGSANCRADILDHWHWRNPFPQANPIRAAAFGNGVYAMAGDAGALFTSEDGVNWTNHDAGTAVNLLGMTWADGLFIAVGTNGTITTSFDGASWTLRTSNTTNGLAAVAGGGGTFVVVGAAGTILLSSDGIAWAPQVSGTTRQLSGVAFGNGMFVAVGALGTILNSSNGVDWAAQTVTSSSFSGITWRSNLFVAIAGTRVVRSIDGLAWNTGSVPASTLTSITHSDDAFVAVDNFGGIFYSTNTTNWTAQYIAAEDYFTAVTYGNGMYIVGSTNAFILASTNGTNWARSNPGTFANLRSVIYVNDMFVAVGEQGAILTSPDGAEWSVQNFDSTNKLFSVAYGNNQFVACGTTPAFKMAQYNSGDAIHWTNTSTATGNVFVKAIFANGRFVGCNGSIWVSSDALNWAQVLTNRPCDALFYGNGLYVAGDSGILVTSPDATNWTVHSVGTAGDRYWTGVYGSGVFLATGFPGTFIRTSVDGTVWTNTPSGFNASISGMLYANGWFLAAADYGTVLTSLDAATWSKRTPKSVRNLWSIAYGKGTYVVVGDNGTILQSDSAITPLLGGARLDSTSIQLSLTGEIGRGYRIQTSSNMSEGSWEDLFIFTNATATTQLIDNASSLQRFYRAVTP